MDRDQIRRVAANYATNELNAAASRFTLPGWTDHGTIQPGDEEAVRKDVRTLARLTEDVLSGWLVADATSRARERATNTTAAAERARIVGDVRAMADRYRSDGPGMPQAVAAVIDEVAAMIAGGA